MKTQPQLDLCTLLWNWGSKVNLKQMKRRTSFQNRSQQKWKSRLLFMLLLCLCVGSFILLLESNPPTMNLPILFAQKPKIAFLFIARNRLPLDFVWDVFFQVSFFLSCFVFHFHFTCKLMITMFIYSIYLYDNLLHFWWCNYE